MARKNFKRRTGRKVTGRQGLWLRQPGYSPLLQETATGVYSDLVATPADWERDYSIGTQPMRGAGASRLERMFGQFHFLTTYDAGVSPPGSPMIELLVWEQSAQFATLVTDTGSFDDVLENQRVFWHATYPSLVTRTIDDSVMQGHCEFIVKSKSRLSDKSVGFAIRLGFSVASGTRVTDVAANWSGYVTTP